MDWVVGITTIISVELMIRKKWYAWLVSLCNQSVWFAYILIEEQWGLLPLNVLLVFQNARGLRAWRRALTQEQSLHANRETTAVGS